LGTAGTVVFRLKDDSSAADVAFVWQFGCRSLDSDPALLHQYARFLAASTTASASFTGLLFVVFALATRDESQHASRDESQHATWESRVVVAASAFLALVDIFFVCLVSSLGGPVVFATANVVMAGVCLLGTRRLVRRAKRAGVLARGFPERKLNLVFAMVAVTLYSVQLVLGIALLTDSQSTGLTRALVFMIVALFVSALGRAWEVAGIRHRSPREPST